MFCSVLFLSKMSSENLKSGSWANVQWRLVRQSFDPCGDVRRIDVSFARSLQTKHKTAAKIMPDSSFLRSCDVCLVLYGISLMAKYLRATIVYEEKIGSKTVEELIKRIDRDRKTI